MIVRNQLPTNIPPGGCRLAFVGEAPAEEEVRTGIPFAPSKFKLNAGRELAMWFQAANIIRSQCYMGNLCQERAPGDKLEQLFVDSKCTKPGDKLQGWINLLKQDLETIRPNCVVAVGGHPLYALTGKTGITKYWGSILPCTLVPGLKVVALPHPAWLIRGWFAFRPIAIAFLRRAVEESAYPEIKEVEREYLLDPPFEMVLHHLHRLMRAEAFAFDIERPAVKPGQPTHITHISFADSPHWAMSIPFVKGRHLRWHESQHAEILRAISALMSTEALKIGHNLMFDFLNISNEWRIPIAPPYWDTMVAHNRCYPDLSDKRLKKLKLNSLAFCTALYTKEPYYKDDYKSENEDNPAWKGSEQEFMLYNAKDSNICYEIMEATKRDLSAFGVLDVFEQRDMKVFEPLAFMGLRGVLRDQKLLQKVTEQADAIIKLTRSRFVEELGGAYTELPDEAITTTLNSPKQLQKILYTDRGHRMEFNRKTGQPTTDEAALKKLARRSNDPIIPIIQQHRRFDKFFDYLETVIPPDGRTRCTYNQARTTTFRISSSASSIDGSGGNLQNIPSYPRPGEEDYNTLIKELKKTYIADPGMVMCRRDYKQGESLIVAYLAEDLEYIQKFDAGDDMHCHSYSDISSVFGKEEDYARVREEYLNGNPDYKIKRNLGKKTEHASNYKMGDRTFAAELAKAGMYLDVGVCRRILDARQAARPRITAWWREVEEILRSTRTMTNCLGRRRYFMGLINDEVIREAIAFEPQSTLGDLLNQAIADIWEDKALIEFIDLLLQIHDALIWQSPTDRFTNDADLISQYMAIPLTIKGRTFTIPTDFSHGPSWGELVEV